MPLLEVEDMLSMGNRPDDRCVFTYVSTIFSRFQRRSTTNASKENKTTTTTAPTAKSVNSTKQQTKKLPEINQLDKKLEYWYIYIFVCFFPIVNEACGITASSIDRERVLVAVGTICVLLLLFFFRYSQWLTFVFRLTSFEFWMFNL